MFKMYYLQINSSPLLPPHSPPRWTLPHPWEVEVPFSLVALVFLLPAYIKKRLVGGGSFFLMFYLSSCNYTEAYHIF